MTTFSELSDSTQYSEEEIQADLLASLQANNFPVTSYNEYSAGKQIIDAFSKVLAKYAAYIPTYAMFGLVEESQGDWLIALGESNYKVTYNRATHNHRMLTITDVKSSETPKTYIAKSLWVKDVSGRKFVNTNDFTVPYRSSISVEFESEGVGNAQNYVSSGWSFITGFAGATVTEPIVTITTIAIDDENLEVYRQRLRDKQAASGDGLTDSKITTWANAADSSIVKTKVRNDYLSGSTTPGAITVYCGAAIAQTIGSSTLTTVRDYLQVRFPQTILIDTKSVDVTQSIISGSITVPQSILSSSKATGEAALVSLEQQTVIGAYVDVDQIKSALLSGVPAGKQINANFISPTVDFQLGTYSVVSFLTSGTLTWIGV